MFPRMDLGFGASICTRAFQHQGSMKRQNPQDSVQVSGTEHPWGFCREICAESRYFRMASLNAFAARSRTTVLALILMASPVWGLRPMRALRCALTARPRLGITNLPALPLHSLTASLKSSSKNVATVFLGVPLLSARWATIFDLLIGFAIVFFFSSSKVSSGFAVSPDCGAVYARHYKDTRRARQAKTAKNTIKMRVPEIVFQNHQYPCGFYGWVKRAAA